MLLKFLLSPTLVRLSLLMCPYQPHINNIGLLHWEDKKSFLHTYPLQISFLFFLVALCLSAVASSILTPSEITACVDSLSHCQEQEAAIQGFTAWANTAVRWRCGVTVSNGMLWHCAVPEIFLKDPSRVIHSFNFNKRDRGKIKCAHVKSFPNISHKSVSPCLCCVLYM